MMITNKSPLLQVEAEKKMTSRPKENKADQNVTTFRRAGFEIETGEDQDRSPGHQSEGR